MVCSGSPFNSPFHLLDKWGSIIEHPSDILFSKSASYFSVTFGSDVGSLSSISIKLVLKCTIQSFTTIIPPGILLFSDLGQLTGMDALAASDS